MSDERYEIRNVWDFAKVPDERLDFCLQEFAVAVRMCRTALKLLDDLADSHDAPRGMFVIGETFTWIDDDRRNATIHIDAPLTEPLSSGAENSGQPGFGESEK